MSGSTITFAAQPVNPVLTLVAHFEHWRSIQVAQHIEEPIHIFEVNDHGPKGTIDHV
jgi:hypothetical protein